MTADLIAKRLRHHAATLRTNSLPLSDLIPLLCQAADALDTQAPAEGDAGLTDEQANALAAFYDVSPGTVHDIYALSKPKAASDTQPKGMCRVRAASQPCDCPVATCNLWRGGLRPADAAEKLRAAHDESLDDKHQSCRSMLLEVVADLEKAPAPSPAPAMHSTALAGLILTHLGYSTEPSLEPGADMRREALARRLDEWLSPATPCAAPAQCTPALKRHALEAADRLAMYAAAPFFPDTEKRGVKRATTAEWWDGLAELIEEAQPLIKRGLHECTAPLADLQAPAVVTDHVNAMRMALEALEKAYGWNATTPMLDTAITGLRDALASQPPVQPMGDANG